MNPKEAAKVKELTGKVKEFLVGAIEADFPFLKVAAFPQYDRDGDTIAGVFITTDGLAYLFSKKKGEAVWIQRTLTE